MLPRNSDARSRVGAAAAQFGKRPGGRVGVGNFASRLAFQPAATSPAPAARAVGPAVLTRGAFRREGRSSAAFGLDNASRSGGSLLRKTPVSYASATFTAG